MKSDTDSGQNNKKALIYRARIVALFLICFCHHGFWKTYSGAVLCQI